MPVGVSQPTVPVLGHLLLKEKAFLGGQIGLPACGWFAMTIGMMGHPP